MAEFTPTLPEGMALPAGRSIDTSHPDYKALEAVAKKHGLSQSAFSDALGLELSRHQRRVAQPPAPSPAPTPKPDFSRMSTSQKIEHALARGPARKPLT